MPRNWFHIAKAEYLVSTASLKGKRVFTIGALVIFGLVWAAILAPFIVGTVIDLALSFELLQTILVTVFPGFMRSVMFFLWIILLITPLSRSLQELKIGQWEILLSNNVKTRDILLGTFLGKIPIYGLLVLYLAPPFLAVFFLVFEVTLTGQALIYITLFIMVLMTIWLSNLITAAIQAKLGESSHGKDLANGLAFLLALVAIIPIYGIMFYSQQLSTILGFSVFLVLPFTWAADVISWAMILFSQLSFSSVQILFFQQVLQFDILVNAALLSIFGLASVGIGLAAADRVFTYNIGARTEQVITIRGENILLRGIRKVAPGSFGTLVVTCLKDFFRKTSNLAKIAYGIILALVLPFIMTQIATGLHSGIDLEMLVMIGGIGMALIGSVTFGGTAFMENKDQLWIIQSTPSGSTRYVKARLAAGFITAIPLCILPAIVTTILAFSGIEVFLFFSVYGYVVICGAIMISTGITAMNPNYENMKSPEHQMNLMITTISVQFLLFAPIFLLIIGDILGLPFWDLLKNTLGFWVGMPATFAILGMMALLIAGGLALFLGNHNLSRPDV